MQILFGAHETVIKINSKSLNIEFIQHYINTHFDSCVIRGNTIKIPTSSAKLSHRVFLLKWLYALYAKRNKPFPELKEILLKRHYKNIKILLPKEIVYSLNYKVTDEEKIHLYISPKNHKITTKIKAFLEAKVETLPTHLEITLKDNEQKKRLQLLLDSNNIIDVPHKHIYNKKKMDEFLSKISDESEEDSKEEKEKVISPIEKAYMVFKIEPTNDIKAIKKQYRNLAKKLHPDTVANTDEELVKLHTQKFQELVESYEILLKSA